MHQQEDYIVLFQGRSIHLAMISDHLVNEPALILKQSDILVSGNRAVNTVMVRR